MIHATKNFLESTLGSFPFLLMVHSIAFAIKLIIFIFLIRHKSNTSTARKSTYLLLLVLLGAHLEDFSWIAKLIYHLFFEGASYQPILFISRIAWAFTIVQYQAFSLFIECLITKPFKLSIRHKIFLTISSIFIVYFLGTAIFHFRNFEVKDRSWLEFALLRVAALYMLIPLMLSCMYSLVRKLKRERIPRILRKQLNLFLKAVMAPYLISDFVQTCPYNLTSSWITYWATNSYAFISISTILLTYAIFYCARKMMGLRFLNMSKHVKSPIESSFINNFKDVFEQLNNAMSLNEIIHITQSRFKDAFRLSTRSISLYLRPFDTRSAQECHTTEFIEIEKKVESVIDSKETELSTYIKKSKILIYDELDFNNFYEEKQKTTAVLQFLDSINADIFLPIFNQQKIIGYIIIDQNARPTQFYSNVERNEMIVLASYLSTILNLIRNRNLETIISKEKEMHEELYRKHQEINQYKESIRSFLRHSKQREIGILFYKNRQFSFENKAAKELIGVNPNVQEGDTLVKRMRHLARDVESYKSAQSCIAHDIHGNKLVLQAIPNVEQHTIIMLVYYPEVSDILTRQMEMLKDPSEWDYLLYLETTSSGRLINKLIPGSGEKILEFKLSLLKAALLSKATLLQMPQEDLKPTVELLHHIRLRTTLHILNLQAPEHAMEVAIKLFGINPIFGIKTKEEPILKKLDGSGTLFIQNIHFLSLETQAYLAELIRFGFYRIFKTEQRVTCDVNIMCSTNQDLNTLVNDGTFSKELFAELRQTQLIMPSLITLPEEELSELASGYSEQTLKQQAFKNFLELTDHEHRRLANNRPSSLQELKTKVQQLLINKSKKNQIYDETLFDPAYEVSDPELIEAARLGKQALKDPAIMAMLWNKFKNQNKIAAFLGVNRSSVNRRCREYNLT